MGTEDMKEINFENRYFYSLLLSQELLSHKIMFEYLWSGHYLWKENKGNWKSTKHRTQVIPVPTHTVTELNFALIYVPNLSGWQEADLV